MTSKKGGNLVFGLSYARVILTTWARVTLGNRDPSLAATPTPERDGSLGCA